MISRSKAVDSISLLLKGEKGKSRWVDFSVGDEVELEDGVYLGVKGSACVYQGTLVGAWKGANLIIPFGTPSQRHEIEKQIHLADTVAHITMKSLQEGCRREHLNWEVDCLPRLKMLIEFLALQIEPVHLCMMAAAKLKRLIKEGRI